MVCVGGGDIFTRHLVSLYTSFCPIFISQEHQFVSPPTSPRDGDVLTLEPGETKSLHFTDPRNNQELSIEARKAAGVPVVVVVVIVVVCCCCLDS